MNRILLIALVLTVFGQNQAEAKLRFASYNIRNFDYDSRSNTPTNKRHLVNIIDEIQADLMAVQEINQKREFERLIDLNYQGSFETVLSDCGGTHGQKLGFVYNTAKFKLIDFKEDMRTVNVNNPSQNHCNGGSRPLAIGKFKILDRNQTLIAISVHLKSGGRANNIKKRFKQLAVIKSVINEYKMQGIENFVVMGDFNSTEYILKGETHHRFKQTVSDMQMVDSTANLSCSAYWWGGAQDAKQYPSALDHILISPTLSRGKVSVESYGHCKKLKCNVTLESQMGVSFDEVSDHCPLVTEIK